MTRRAVLSGTGSALPRTRVSNAELAKRVDTSDEWIVERTGIRFRHIAEPDETTGTLGAAAAKEALKAAGLEPSDIGLIIVATATPDNTFPATATKVQALIGAPDCIAFDVAAVCSGFLYAVSVADSMLRTGAAKHALVIGSETFSRILDWEDRTTCVLFGDGAGAIILSAEEVADEAGAKGRGILATRRARSAMCGCRDAKCSAMPSPILPPCSVKCWPTPGCRRRMSTGWCRIRRTAASSTRPRRSWAFPPSASC
jgi:3-oxoacyl-[acyl-carrier-protein] synthase-3